MADWNTVWSAVQAIGTVGAVGVAAYQIAKLRADQRGWETLKACERYDTDPVIEAALVRLKVGRDGVDLLIDTKKYSLDATTVLNYLEGIATGICQGFYDERVVRDHLERIMRDHIGEFLSEDIAKGMELSKDDYCRLEDLLSNWGADKPYYKRGRL